MTGLKDRTFITFIFLYLFFVLISAPVWNTMVTKGEDVELDERRWLIYSTYLLAIYISLILFYIIKSHLFYKTEDGYQFKGIFRFKIGFIHWICLLWCLVMPVIVFINKGALPQYFQLILWPLIFEMSYLVVLHSPERINTFYRFYWIIFIWGVFLFLTSKGTGYGVVSPNAVFVPLLTMPFLLIKNNQRYRFYILILFTILILISMKRSSMLIIAAAWLAYGLPFLKIKNKLVALASIGLLAIVVLFLFSRLNNAFGGEIMERITREETDTGRNRLAIWAVSWSMIQESSVKDLLHGHGHFGVRKNSILEISAHNDIMEVIYDYGLVVFVLYIGLWIYVFKRCWEQFKEKSSYFLPYSVSLAIFVFMSLVSHLVLYASYFNFLVMFWGCMEGLRENKKLSST